MKTDNALEVNHKDVVILGNGPSGIVLSYMLSGNIPYVISDLHPDEFLSARLRPVINQNLVKQDLGHLAGDLEGRSRNPVSLLIDALTFPYADIGLEMAPLVEWRNDGKQVDHIVLGKGPPGGSWHTMDPHILTLSLGSWMALPGLPYKARDGFEKRASAKNVARYYEEYVNKLNLSRNFKTGIVVTKIKYLNPQDSEIDKEYEIKEDYFYADDENENSCDNSNLNITERQETGSKKEKSCSISSALNFIISRAQRRGTMDRCCKRRREILSKHDLSPDRKMREVENYKTDNVDILELYPNLSYREKMMQLKLNDINRRRFKDRSISLCCDSDSFNYNCDSVHSKSYNDRGSFFNFLRNTNSLELSVTKVPVVETQLLNLRDCDAPSKKIDNHNNIKPKWLVEAYDLHKKTHTSFTCNYLVLANGSSDLPNKLEISNNQEDPVWLLHDVRSLEIELDLYLQENPENPDPVLIVGAGLSAADAVIAARSRNIPVIHVFRNKSTNLSKQLPENMYPEYHKVHQMMKDGGSTYPLYTALPEHNLVGLSEKSRTVTLRTKSGDKVEYSVSFVAVLIGSRPDLSFLPENINLGVNKNIPIDCKNNTINIDKLNHRVIGMNGLYAVGPLAGDNFVRFLPGGALAIVSDLYTKYGF